MTDNEIREMEIRIDEGIRLAQRRLIQRAIYDHQALVFSQNGKIVEQGTHKKLLSKNGEYAKLWNRQSGAFLE